MTSATVARTWPAEGLTRVPYWVYCDRELFAAEQARIFEGPTWSFLCLEAELPEAGTYRRSNLGAMPVVVTRDQRGELHAFENRCAHRGSLLVLNESGSARDIVCVYHNWSYDLAGNLTGVAFRKGVGGKGGMPPDAKPDAWPPRKLRVATLAGLVFGTLSQETPPLEIYLGAEIEGRIRRVMRAPVKLLGGYSQMLASNWKLYMENVKDSYHASLLHTFFTTFQMNRLSQQGALIISEGGGNHVSYSVAARPLPSPPPQAGEGTGPSGGERALHPVQRAPSPASGGGVGRGQAGEGATDAYAGMRAAQEKFSLAAPALLDWIDEFGDGIGLQILTVFPSFTLQQTRNSLAVRRLVPRALDETELAWTCFGFTADDDAMTERRLQQANLIGPAGYISMEDGAAPGFVQRAAATARDLASVVEMGGASTASSDNRVTEAAVRGFWKTYRALMGL